MTVRTHLIHSIHQGANPISPCPSTEDSLGIQLVSDLGELESLAPAWLSLLDRSGNNQPMLAPNWLLTWWRIYGQGRQLAVGQFLEDDRLVGLAPMLRRPVWYRPGIPFRRLEFLGAEVDEGDGVCSDYLSVIAERGGEPRVAKAFAAAVVGGAFGTWDEVHLAAMPGDNPMTDLVADAFCRADFDVTRVQTTAAPYIPLPATWDLYLQQLPKKCRYAVVRAERDFNDWAAGAAAFHRASSLDELERGKSILTALHTERWEAAGTNGVFDSRRFAAFHDAVMPQLLEAKALALLWLSVRGEPVAAMYNIVWDNKVHFYQSGRKLDVPRQLRLGVVIICQAIRQAIEAGRREFDFLAGEALYKKQLALARRPLVQLRIARRTWRERAHGLTESALQKMRVVRKTCRSAWHQLRPLR